MHDTTDPETFAIIGAAMEVHRHLGHGFLEAVYHEAFAQVMRDRSIPFQREAWLTMTYKGTPLLSKYKADFICFGNVIVEIKAASDITGSYRAQVINYLKATNTHRGLIINFGLPSLRYERLVWGESTTCLSTDFRRITSQ